MKVTFTPEDGQARTWTYRHGKVRASEAEMCERRLEGTKWDAFEANLLQGSARARRVLLWHLLRQEHPALKWDDVPDFCMDELVMEMDLDDQRRYRARMDSLPKTPDVVEALAALDEGIAEEEAAEAEATETAETPEEPSGEPAGKAASKRAARSTG